jgi:hypothetical protein
LEADSEKTAAPERYPRAQFAIENALPLWRSANHFPQVALAPAPKLFTSSAIAGRAKQIVRRITEASFIVTLILTGCSILRALIAHSLCDPLFRRPNAEVGYEVYTLCPQARKGPLRQLLARSVETRLLCGSIHDSLTPRMVGRHALI